MKKFSLLISVLTVIVIPWVYMSILSKHMASIAPAPTVITFETVKETTDTAQVSKMQTLSVLTESGVQEMPLEDYVAGVLMGEMPAEFETEALRAQAVAIRTYTLRKLRSRKHENADVCTDPGCCQAFTAEAEYTGTEEHIVKIKLAAADTKGQVLTYDGDLIDATYFSCSGGMTEAAVTVWGRDVPYLQAISSPGEEASRNYVKTVTFNGEDFLKKLSLPANQRITTGSITYTDGGGVDTMEICGAEFSGIELRKLLGLTSTAFQMQCVQDSVIVTCRGNGHRVGLSQYGAEAMAVSGSDYRKILAHYYPGTTLETWPDDQLQALFDKVGNL